MQDATEIYHDDNCNLCVMARTEIRIVRFLQVTCDSDKNYSHCWFVKYLGGKSPAFTQVLVGLLKALSSCEQMRMLDTFDEVKSASSLGSVVANFQFNNNNNNSNFQDKVYGAVIMAEPLRELPGLFDECRTAPSGRRPSDQAKRLRLSVRLYRLPESTPIITNLPFIIISQPESWYSFYRPAEGRRLSRHSWLVTYRDGLPAHRRSPILVLTGWVTVCNHVLSGIMHGHRCLV